MLWGGGNETAAVDGLIPHTNKPIKLAVGQHSFFGKHRCTPRGRGGRQGGGEGEEGGRKL